MQNDLYDEWAKGASLATNSNDFFEEVPTELNNPQNFVVPVEQLPANPLEVAPAIAVEPIIPAIPVESNAPETRTTKKGGKIVLEKTSRGWRATLDTNDPKFPAENFYGNNKDELIFTICEAKLESTQAIHKLKKEKLLGGEEPTSVATPRVQSQPLKAHSLTADEVYEIKNKLQDNPVEAFDMWLQKRFGADPDKFTEALQKADAAKRIVDAQEIKASVDEVNSEFIRSNPDYSEKYATAENARLLIGRMSKAYLNKKITKTTPQATVDDAIFELFNKGFWTADNLETAKDELIDGGLLESLEPRRTESEPQQQPVVTQESAPSVPQVSRIAAQTGQPVVFGNSERNNAPSEVPVEKTLTDVDLQSMPIDQLRQLARVQLQALHK